MRQDEKRTLANHAIRTKIRHLLTSFRKTRDQKQLPDIYTALDRAAKHNIIHTATASRLKARATRSLKAA